jgi:hypothetical protein
VGREFARRVYWVGEGMYKDTFMGEGVLRLIGNGLDSSWVVVMGPVS